MLFALDVIETIKLFKPIEDCHFESLELVYRFYISFLMQCGTTAVLEEQRPIAVPDANGSLCTHCISDTGTDIQLMLYIAL